MTSAPAAEPEASAETRTGSAIFITGAAGFIGGRVLPILSRVGGRQVRCLVREGSPSPDGAGVVLVRGELARADTYARALEGVHTVLHLAARTGKGSRADHLGVNRDGTAALVRAAREARVSRFINVSSIAATYQRRPAYHYAEAKAAGEEIVRASGLAFLNVRPTLVLGRGSAVGAGLLKLARLPVVPLFGGGGVRVQPIHVDDVARYLVDALDNPRSNHHDVDLGGPEIVSMKELLTRLRRAATGRHGRYLPIAGLPTMLLLAAIEPIAGRFLPLSAGQLSAFVNDSIVKATTPSSAAFRCRFSLDAMIRDTVSHA